MNYLELFSLLAPEAVLVFASLAVLAVDLLALQDVSVGSRRLICAWLTCGGCIAAGIWTVAQAGPANLMQGLLVLNGMTSTVKVALLALTAFTALLSVDSDFTVHIGEYFALLLMATVGLMLLVSSEDLLVIFVSLELTSVCLYVLAGFNKRNPRSAEAALKYFLFGSMAAAFTLFGISLLYGILHSTRLPEIAGRLNQLLDVTLPGHNHLDPLLAAAIAMTFIGFGFKVAAAPFHLWAPDAYQGAPIPSAALIASGSKVGGFFVLARLMMVGLSGPEGTQGIAFGWVPLLAGVAVVSMILGNLAALAQKSVRRLLAYSAIAHAGYALVAVTAPGENAFSAVVFYSITYAIAALGAFAVVAYVEQMTGGDDLEHLGGLARQSPLAAACMLVFILSLAGIPPFSGFFGKFYVFAAALKAGGGSLALLWLVVLAIAASAVSLYYYLQILKQVYVRVPSSGFPVRGSEVRRVESLGQARAWVLMLLASATILLGCFPDLLIRLLR